MAKPLAYSRIFNTLKHAPNSLKPASGSVWGAPLGGSFLAVLLVFYSAFRLKSPVLLEFYIVLAQK